ncbi:M48 family metalloprotease [Streptomyces corynorhini]|uniref:Uncharacterized protein n=1 Tax=Streptomyces corynorhini TaxID=2282652 RepID=A0A370BCC0_9ACTN|nr:hypothetical protein [Streptomyces corynorhini]RDG37834.1 hypothetical protein DVH02_12260 [Streptomyces corynorhini]
MSDSGMGEGMGAQGARVRALAVLRVRSRALALALLPTAAAVVLLVGGGTGHLRGAGWDAARWGVTALAVAVLLLAAAVAALVARARPALSPTVPVAEKAAPDLYRLVRELAERLDVPAPSAIALTPDCDSWLEDRTHPGHAKRPSASGRGRYGLGGPYRRPGPARGAGAGGVAAPVLVIGSPFLWWMRVAELRAVLAPVVAGTGPAAHPDIAAARRLVRGLDAAVAVTSRPGTGPIRRVALALPERLARVLLRACGEHAALMERGVATAASERAQEVDYGLRIVAQEQVGLAYAGWDRLLTRVALPAWRMGRWPSRLDAGVVSALTELSRRDRLAEGFASRLGERPACDLLEEPGAVDEAASLLAARLFHGGPADAGPDWSPVDWQQYPEEVVDRKWRTEAARLHRVLDGMGVRPAARSAGTGRSGGPAGSAGPADTVGPLGSVGSVGSVGFAGAVDSLESTPDPGPNLARVMDHLAGPEGGGGEVGDALAAGISAELAREEAVAPPTSAEATGDAFALWGADPLPLFPLQPPRTGRELLADHVTAMVCCSAVDTAGAAPGLDWLDGPALLIDGERRAELPGRVLSLVEDGDAEPLRAWLASLGVRPEKPVRLV